MANADIRCQWRMDGKLHGIRVHRLIFQQIHIPARRISAFMLQYVMPTGIFPYTHCVQKKIPTCFLA